MSDLVYLFESYPYDPVSGQIKRVFFSSGLLTEGELTTQADAYPVRLKQAFTHETSIFEENVPGQTNISLGSTTINNTDGRFDYLLGYNWDTRAVTIKRGERGKAYNTYTTEFVGSALEITANGSDLVITLRDNSYKLIAPIQINKYKATGGAEGGEDLREKPKPLLFGKARNLSPVWVDSVQLVFQINDGSLSSVDAIYDKGNLLTFHANYTSYANLIAANIPPGKYGTYLNGGYARLGAPPAGSLTVDAVGFFSGTTDVPTLAKTILLNRAGMSGSDLDTAAFAQAALDAPYPFEGLYFQEPDFQYDELMETLASSVNAFWCVTRTGLITFSIFKFTTSVAQVRQEDIMELGRGPSPKPLYRLKVNYGKNATVQPSSDFTIPRQTFNGYLTKRYHYVNVSAGEGSADYSGAGQFKAFLNDTQVNDFGLISFSIPNGESWIAIDTQGNITVTNSGVASATATVRASLGEFYWDEPFTLIRDSVAPLQSMALTLGGDRFYFDNNNQPSPSVQTISVSATGTNTTAPITTSAVDNLGNAVPISGGNISIADVLKSPLVFYIEVSASDANGVTQKRRIMVQHGEDAYAEGILGSYAVANGAVTFFYQTSAPTSGMQVDDVWIDTDDANKQYRWTGSSWASISDTRINDALTAAAGAQATADGKIKTYYSETTPTASAVGDLWYKASTKTLTRWDGSNWTSAVGTYGAQAGASGSLFNQSGGNVTDPQILNSAVSISSGGVLSGAGGGTVTVSGIGYSGALADLDATSFAQLQSSVAAVTSAADDNIINKDEKNSSLIPLYNDLEARYANVRARAVALGLSTTTLDNARSAWLTLIDSWGKELVINGLFDVDTSSWAAGNGAVLSTNAGRLRVTAPGTPQYGHNAVQQITGLVIGQTYSVIANAFAGTAGNTDIRVGTTSGGTQYGRAQNSDANITFTATQTNVFITLLINTTPAAGAYVEFDNVSLQKSLRTYRWDDIDNDTKIYTHYFSDELFPTGWTANSGIISSQNGPYSTITDTNASAQSSYIRSKGSAPGNAKISGGARFKKDSIPRTTRFPAILLRGSGGTVNGGFLSLDTSTGEIGYITSGGTGLDEYGVLDLGTDWFIWATATASSGNTNADLLVYPAEGANSNLATGAGSAVGSVDVKPPRIVLGDKLNLGRDYFVGLMNAYVAAIFNQLKVISENDWGARSGLSLFNSSLTLLNDPQILNSAVSISAGGALSGAGGGTVTIGGLGYAGDLNATRNRIFRQTTDPGAIEDNAFWVDTAISAMPILRHRVSSVWQIGGSYGARAGTNLLDSANSSMGDSTVKNSAVSLTAAGALSGAGGGSITALDFANVAGSNKPENLATVDANITGDSLIIVAADSSGVPLSGELSKIVLYKLFRLGSAVSSGITWSCTRLSGNATFTTSGTGTLTLTITGPTDATLAAESVLRLSATYSGVPRTVDVKVVKQNEPPTDTTGGTGGTSDSSTSLGVTAGNTVASVVWSSTMTCKAGSGGRVDCSAPLGFKRTPGNVAGQTGCQGKWQWRIVGGTFADISTAVSHTTPANSDDGGGGDPIVNYAGAISVSQAKTGLTNGTSYEFRFGWWDQNVSGTAQHIYRSSGTLVITGS